MGRLRRVVIDLTPVLPGGENGGAKLVARALVQELTRLAPDVEFQLLTSLVSHDEFADLDAPHVRRQCTDADIALARADDGALGAARMVGRLAINTLLPVETRSRAKDRVWTLFKRHRRRLAAKRAAGDVLLCPFTAPFFFDPQVPLVSVVHDLQFLDHPEFFGDQTRLERTQHFEGACARADRLICVSEFVRQSVLHHSTRSPASVQTIHSGVLHATLDSPDAVESARAIARQLGLGDRRFLLYPANAWPHKNHARLIEAFAAFLQREPATDLALICTGAPGAMFDEVLALSQRLLPDGVFGFAGYLSEHDFAALLRHCRALIFPSLYEGFGLPVLEAMACGRPVLCSDVTSLPEIAADAAMLFDPYRPSTIAEAIVRLQADPSLEATIVSRGHERVAAFGTARRMAEHYLDALEDVVASRSE